MQYSLNVGVYTPTPRQKLLPNKTPGKARKVASQVRGPAAIEISKLRSSVIAKNLAIPHSEAKLLQKILTSEKGKFPYVSVDKEGSWNIKVKDLFADLSLAEIIDIKNVKQRPGENEDSFRKHLLPVLFDSTKLAENKYIRISISNVEIDFTRILEALAQKGSKVVSSNTVKTFRERVAKAIAEMDTARIATSLGMSQFEAGLLKQILTPERGKFPHISVDRKGYWNINPDKRLLANLSMQEIDKVYPFSDFTESHRSIATSLETQMRILTEGKQTTIDRQRGIEQLPVEVEDFYRDFLVKEFFRSSKKSVLCKDYIKRGFVSGTGIDFMKILEALAIAGNQLRVF